MELNKSNIVVKNISNFKKFEEKDEKDKIQKDSESIFGALMSNSSSNISDLSKSDMSEINLVLDEQSEKTIKTLKLNLDDAISRCSSCASTLLGIRDYQEKYGRNFFDDVLLTYGKGGTKIFDEIIKKLDDPEALTKKTPLAFSVGGIIADCITHHSISSRCFAEKFVENCSNESLTAALKRRSLDKLANYYMPKSRIARKLTEKYLDIRGKLNDGKIESTSQGNIGDCWLLTGINAMSYSSTGQELLNNAVSETENGYSVRLEGLNKDVEVTKKELAEAIQSEAYSTGDPDMLLFELAFEKGLGEVENKVDSTGESEGQSDEHAAIDGGNMLLFISALTGKKTKTVTNKKGYNNESYLGKNPISKFFGKFLNKLTEPFEYTLDLQPTLDKIENSDDIIASVSFMSKSNNEERTITDVDGKKHRVTGSSSDSRHTCAIKSIDGDLVTIVNPWNSNEDIVVTKKELLDNVYSIAYCDLSEE